MNCPNCNQSIADGARFCGSCGKSLAAPAASPPAPGFGAQPALAAMGPAVNAAPPDSPFAGRTTAPMLLQRVKNILLSPKTEWPVIAPESTLVGKLYTGYVLPLTAFAAILSFLRMSVIGMNMPFGGTIRLPMTSGLLGAAQTLIAGLVGLFLVGIIITSLAPTFGGEKDLRQALKTAAYAFTPGWLSAVFGLLPSFGTLLTFIAGIYGIYLLYLGLPLMMRSPKDRAGGYTATVVICTIIVGILIGALGVALGMGRAGGLAALGAGTSSEEQKAAAREQGAATVGSLIGGALGTDEKGKAGLTAALSNLAKMGEDAQKQEAQSAAGSAQPQAASSSASAAGAGAAGSTPSQPDVQNAAAAVGGLMSALGGALGGSHRVNPVDFHTLQSELPASLPGMKRTGAQGSNQQTMGVHTSSATANYLADGGGRVQIKIGDVSGVSGLMDAAGALVGTVDSESDTGYEKDVALGGRTVHEKYDRKAKHGELSVIVAKRFEVDVTGDAVDMPALEKSLGSVDLSKLESMKDVGAVAAQ